MLVAKAALLKTLRIFQRFDSGGSPYIGLQFGADAPLFHRAGSEGFIETIGYDRTCPAVAVSLGHFLAMLTNTSAEEVELSQDKNGVLAILGTHEFGVDDMRVYTVRPDVTWAKTHEIGERTIDLDPAAFRGINTGPFTLVCPPVLRRSRLMLATDYGVIMRNDVPVEAYPYPSGTFLRASSLLPVEALHLTQCGYWGVQGDGLRVLVAGHRFGDHFFDMYSVGAARLGELPAERFVGLLRTAADLSGDAYPIVIDPQQGVVVRDGYGQQNRFTFTSGGGWSAFAVLPKAARTIYDALSQTKEETIELEQMDPERLRMRRGSWEISFRFTDPNTKR